MNNQKVIKEFIDNLCSWIENEYKNEGHTRFAKLLRNDRLSYLIADEGIERRIEKQLFKRLGLKTRVRYRLYPSIHQYLDDEIDITIYKPYEPFEREYIREWYEY